MMSESELILPSSKPWYIDLFWPVAHVFVALRSCNKKPTRSPSAAAVNEIKSCSVSSHAGKMKLRDVPLPKLVPINDVWGHLASIISSFRAFVLALFLIRCIHGGYDPENGYPAFGRGTSFEWSWILPLLFRNLGGTLLVAGLWDWFLYFSPLQQALSKYKMNQSYPSLYQIHHDALMTLLASTCGTAVEVVLCHGLANGRWEGPTSDIDWIVLLQALTMRHWREVQFYCIHRVMHPWKIRGLPKSWDPGHFLYRHVHSVHHKSHNPTAFSGTNMHPVEATLYYGVAFIPPIFFSGRCNPAVSLATIIDCGIAAWVVHDGFQWPGSGDYYHLLHHQHFDCNFGTPNVPIDKWCGSYAGNAEEVKQLWSKTGHDAGAGANETPVHQQSLKGKVE